MTNQEQYDKMCEDAKKYQKLKLNSEYGRSCTMKLTHPRYVAMEFISTLVRCLRKNMLEPDEPLVEMSCEQIRKYYMEDYIDPDLYGEVIEVLAELGVEYDWMNEKY